MPITSISDLVTDWGGFEKLVAELHLTGDVSVERNVILTGKSGATRQIDVLVRHRQGFYDHIVIIECKYLKRSVSRQMIDALAATIQELNGSKGVIFSTKGFQKGAIQQAKQQNIELFRIRDAKIICDRRFINCLSRISCCGLLGVTSLSSKTQGKNPQQAWKIIEEYSCEKNIKEKEFEILGDSWFIRFLRTFHEKMWTYLYFLYSDTTQLIKEVAACPQAYCTMVLAFRVIAMYVRSISKELLCLR